MAERRVLSGSTSLFDKAIEEMLKKLEGDASSEASKLRDRAFALKKRVANWVNGVTVEEKTQATDEMFALFRQVMDKRQ